METDFILPISLLFFSFFFFFFFFFFWDSDMADSYVIWAKSWENLFMPYANDKGADQPAIPQSDQRLYCSLCG